MRNERVVSLLLLGVLFSAGPASAFGAEEDSQIAVARERYGADEWARGPRHAGLDLSRIDFPSLRGSALEYDADGAEVVRRYHDAAGNGVLLLELHVRENVEMAQSDLLADIAFVQSVKLLPRTKDRGIVAGDAGFIGYAGVNQDRIAWIAFVEGNLELRVVALDPSAEPSTDVARVAERLAEAIRAMPVLEDDAVLPRPAIDRVAFAEERCLLGESVRVDVQATDPGGDSVVLEYALRGSAQGHLENRPNEGLRLRTTKAGTLELEVRAWNRLGVVNRATASLTVEPSRAKR